MPSRIPQLKPQEVIRALEKLGFVIRRTTGSHWILRHPETKRIASVPLHPRDIKRGLLFGILRQTGISQGEFLNALEG
ncbi:MAG: type II toxin-antitoxin system HicA family toxin [bacterium]|nr:type II toxin-antitoxin system HicA family toxin [bacterium]MDP2703969.1 type II toxin-antitoxin system HicA family toxin [bacterium]